MNENTAPESLPLLEGYNHWTNTDYFEDSPLHLCHAFLHLNYTFNMHSHEFYEININTRGSGYQYFGGKKIPVSKGDVFVIPPELLHGHYSIDNCDIMHIIFHPSFLSRYQEEVAEMPNLMTFLSAEPFIRPENPKLMLTLSDSALKTVLDKCEEMIELLKSNEKSRFVICNALLMEILAICCKGISAERNSLFKGDGRVVPTMVLRSADHIHRHFAENIKVEKLAKIACMSKTLFVQNFQSIFHCSPKNYIEKIRIGRAKELLVIGKKSVTEIAEECGFYDASHLFKIFRAMEGKTVKEWQKENKK